MATAGPADLVGRIGKLVSRSYELLGHNRITRFPWAVIQTFSKAQGALLAGAMAYYTFLSVPSLLLVAGFVVGTVASSAKHVESALIDAANRLLPVLQGTGLVESLINTRAAFGIIGLLSTFYAASGFVGALTASLNRMWEVETGRNPIWQKGLNILVVVLLGIALVGSAMVTIWAGLLAEHSFGAHAPTAVRTIDWIGTPVTILLVLLLLYRMLPARKVTLLGQLPGAIVGATGFLLLKWGFGIWADHSKGLSALPRSVLSLVLLLIWLGFFSQLILYGAAVNVVWHRWRQHGSLLPD